MKRKSAAALLLLATAVSTARAQPSEIVAFGASFTDTGNVFITTPSHVGYAHPPSPPNFEGRASNGPLWIDVFADLLGVDRPIASLAGGNNFAYSGATTGAVHNLFEGAFPGAIADMDSQVATFLREKSVSGDELFVVAGWASANDFANDQPIPAEPAAAADRIGQAVSDLVSAGANNILVPLGVATPRISDPGSVVPFNVALRSELAKIRITHPNASIIEFAAQPILDGILADPSSIGVKFVTGQACNDCRFGIPNPVEVADNPNDYLYWDGAHFTTPVNEALGRAAFETFSSPYLINESFDYLPPDTNLPAGTTLLDSNVGQPWGPSKITSENGKISFQTTGEVPPHDPPERPLETGFMALSWNVSETDPQYSDGFLRATLRADTPSDANLFMRADLQQLSGYLFTGIGATGEFRAICFCDSGELGIIPGFEVGTEYHMEAGTVGNRITIKVWAVGAEEPELPQLVVFDDGRSQGTLGIIPASSPTLSSDPTRVDITYDEVRFMPSVLGDVDQNSVLDVSDIDRLTEAVLASDQHPFFDLNQDNQVDDHDRVTWVRGVAFAHTYFGDANLDGEFDSSDFVEVFQSGKYETGELTTWGQGDWNGDRVFDSGDFVTAFQDGGYEMGPRPAVTVVPEPASIPSLFVCLAIFMGRRLNRYGVRPKVE